MSNEKNVIKKVMEKVAIKVATIDANTACPCITYQPQLPDAVKELRKNSGK